MNLKTEKFGRQPAQGLSSRILSTRVMMRKSQLACEYVERERDGDKKEKEEEEKPTDGTNIH